MTNPAAEQLFGDRVRSLRLQAGLSQAAFAELLTTSGLPITQQTVAKIEAGRRPTSVGELAVIAKVFGMGMTDLLAVVDEALGAGATHYRLSILAQLEKEQEETDGSSPEVSRMLKDVGAGVDRMAAKIAAQEHQAKTFITEYNEFTERIAKRMAEAEASVEALKGQLGHADNELHKIGRRLDGEDGSDG